MNFQRWIHEKANTLIQSESPRRDVEILLEFVTGKSCSSLFSFPELSLTIEQEKHFLVLLNRRKQGEPVAYLTGEHEFWSLPLYVSKATLIPRSDTECLVEQALTYLSVEPNHILDLGTGTGAIALAIAKERPDCKIIAVDLIDEAVLLARRNIKRLLINNVCAVQSNWFEAVSNFKFEMIISNPPYIDANDPHLLSKNMQFEPFSALVSHDNGMADIKYIILNSRKYLTSGGWLLVEHGWKQGRKVRTCFLSANFLNIKTCRDYGGNERLTLGKMP